ncbi:hypothetical protein NDU88_002948 [Pleurodeles waltl]|uniref:Uncharacterized protein n=1 Tax=Pleurodeles waltl TaxID=8319 RepID=A0AAV7SE94_PLEWA|nr:hypothetical protein NDU88_002948 [Pleurodeles waltl]
MDLLGSVKERPALTRKCIANAWPLSKASSDVVREKSSPSDPGWSGPERNPGRAPVTARMRRAPRLRPVRRPDSRGRT